MGHSDDKSDYKKAGDLVWFLMSIFISDYTMYITKMTHFLNEKGNIPQDIPKEAREPGNFLALIVDSTTLNEYEL